MKRLAIIPYLIVFSGAVAITAGGAQEGYPEGTLTPTVDLELRPVAVRVPKALRDKVPEDLTLNVPPGFSVSFFAAGLRIPRFMALDENGVLHVANMGADQIVALPDRDRDGVADQHIVAARGFKEAHSLAFYQGEMYVADTDEIVKFSDADGDLVYEESQVLTDLTSPGPCCRNGWHTTRTLVIDTAAEKMYVGIGSPCDLCRSSAPTQADRDDPLPPNPEWGAILEFNIDGTGRRIFATGVRNVIGMTRHPVSNELWANNNGHNLQGRSSPPEWIDIVRDGDFLGHPLVNSHQVWNDFSIAEYQKVLPITPEDSLLVARHKKPVALVPAHYAPMGLHFYTRDMFPDMYQNAAFVSFHAGKAFLSSHPGYNVSVLFSDADGSNARIGEFITGFQTGTTQSSVWGFPVGIASDAEGSLYITSDKRTPAVLKVDFTPLTGTWRHNVPDVISVGSAVQVQATVQAELFEPDGGPLQVTADLSEVGGPQALPLVAVGDNAYELDVPLDVSDLPSGEYLLRVNLQQEIGGELRHFALSHTLSIVPRDDLPIMTDVMAAGWQMVGAKGTKVLGPTAAGPVYFGATAMGVEVASEKLFQSWSLELTPEVSVDPFGFAGLRFAFHPGVMEGPQINILTLFINDSGTDLVRGTKDDKIDLLRPEWQVVEVPLEAFNPRLQGPVTSIRLEGQLKGTFYLDDVRFVKRIPAAPPSVATAIVEGHTDARPGTFTLEQNYPNPFNSGTEIGYSLPQAAMVDLVVYNMAGQRVARLAYGWREAGVHLVQWDGLDDADQELASGMYVYRLSAGARTMARKLVLLR